MKKEEDEEGKVERTRWRARDDKYPDVSFPGCNGSFFREDRERSCAPVLAPSPSFSPLRRTLNASLEQA